MATVDKAPVIPAEDMADLQKAVNDMISGVTSPDEMERAAKEMDEGREEIRRRFGELNVAVELTDPDVE